MKEKFDDDITNDDINTNTNIADAATNNATNTNDNKPKSIITC